MRPISLNKAPAQQPQNVHDDVTRYALWVMKSNNPYYALTSLTLRELPLIFYAPRCVSFFYAPNCINAPQKVNLKKMHPAAFYFSCTYTNGISLRTITKDFIATQNLINETALNLQL